MKTQLEVGDKLKRFDIIREIEFVYEIKTVTKTQAKSVDGTVFKRELIFNTTLPMEHYVAEVYLQSNRQLSKRYFLIN